MRYTHNLKKAFDDYYLNSGDTVYTRGEIPRSEYVSPYKENFYLPNHNIARQKCYDKLGQLEDIEDELEIDLVTLFNLLKNNECFEKENGLCYIIGFSLNGIILMPKAFSYGECEFTRPFSEFGKTWALTKEELL